MLTQKIQNTVIRVEFYFTNSFRVSFALLVNAKNIEIKKQNKAIEIAVQELKKIPLKKRCAKLLEAQQAKN